MMGTVRTDHQDGVAEYESTEAGASIRWTGVTQDPRYYDQRARPTAIAVEASMAPTLFVR